MFRRKSKKGPEHFCSSPKGGMIRQMTGVRYMDRQEIKRN